MDNEINERIENKHLFTLNRLLVESRDIDYFYAGVDKCRNLGFLPFRWTDYTLLISPNKYITTVQVTDTELNRDFTFTVTRLNSEVGTHIYTPYELEYYCEESFGFESISSLDIFNKR